MADILQDQYILGQSTIETISTVGQEVAINLTLVPQPSVTFGSATGTVTDGTNPLPGAYVKIMDRNYNPITHTVTDASGNFTFTNLTPNTIYYAFASTPGYNLATSSQFTVTTAAITNLGNIVLSANPNATDSIIAGDLSDNATGAGISGAVCFLYKPDVVSGNPVLLEITYTNIQGQFVFRKLDASAGPIQYTITFTALGYKTGSIITTLSGSAQIVYLPNATLDKDPVTSSGTVSGMITDSNGPIAGADVILYSVNTTTGALTPIAFTQTNSNGVYLFFNISAGSYLIKSNKMAETSVTI